MLYPDVEFFGAGTRLWLLDLPLWNFGIGITDALVRLGYFTFDGYVSVRAVLGGIGILEVGPCGIVSVSDC